MTAVPVAARFGAAARRYEDHAPVQRITAERLADDIALLPLPRHPRILEIGCGTGLLTRALARRIGPADWTVTDISPGMLAAAQSRPPRPARSATGCSTASAPKGCPGATT